MGLCWWHLPWAEGHSWLLPRRVADCHEACELESRDAETKEEAWKRPRQRDCVAARKPLFAAGELEAVADDLDQFAATVQEICEVPDHLVLGAENRDLCREERDWEGRLSDLAHEIRCGAVCGRWRENRSRTRLPTRTRSRNEPGAHR